MSAGKHICCGYENGAVMMLDLKGGNSVFGLAGGEGGQGHSRAVTSIAMHHDSALLLTGSQDETAKLIHSNSGKVVHLNIPCAQCHNVHFTTTWSCQKLNTALVEAHLPEV